MNHIFHFYTLHGMIQCVTYTGYDSDLQTCMYCSGVWCWCLSEFIKLMLIILQVHIYSLAACHLLHGSVKSPFFLSRRVLCIPDDCLSVFS